MLSIQDALDRIVDALRIDTEVAIRVGVRVFAIWLLAWVSWRLIGIATRRIEAAMDDGNDTVVSLREKRGKTISHLLRSVGRVVVVTVALLLTLNLFIDIAPLLAGAGILGLAVSFGAQSLVRDVITGFFMLVENQFVIGDVIEAAGKNGVVEEMTLRVVTLRDLEGAVHVIPNGEIKSVTNRTRGWSRAVVDVSIPYAENVDRAIDIIRSEAEALAADEEWMPLLDGKPEVWGVESLSDTSATLRMVVRTQPGSHWGVARAFRLRIRKRLQAEGIGAPVQVRRVDIRVDGTGAAGVPLAPEALKAAVDAGNA